MSALRLARPIRTLLQARLQLAAARPVQNVFLSSTQGRRNASIEPDPPPFPVQGKTAEQSKTHEQSKTLEPIKHLEHADAASESAKAEIPEASYQADALLAASEQPETTAVPPDQTQTRVRAEIPEAATTLEQQEMPVPAESSQTVEAHVQIKASEPERVELEGAQEHTPAQLPAEVTEQAMSTGEMEAPVLDKAPDATEVSEQAMPIGETEAPMQLESSAIEQTREETEVVELSRDVEQTEAPEQMDEVVQTEASAEVLQQTGGDVQMEATDAVELDQVPERTETSKLEQVSQQEEVPEASMMEYSTETAEPPQQPEGTVQIEAPVPAEAVQLEQAPETTESAELEQALLQKEAPAQLDEEPALTSGVTETVVQGEAEQEQASTQIVASMQGKTQELTEAAGVDAQTQKAALMPRMPRSLSSLYLAPLRREAHHGVPTCDLQLRSFSLRGLEFFCDFALRAAYYLNLPAFGPVPLPRKIQRWTVPKSNFIFKKSQENFERVTVRRLIQIRDGHPESVQAWLAFLQKHQHYGVGMKANVWEFSELNVGKHMDKKAKEVEALVEDKWELLGQHRDGHLNTVEKVEEFLQSERVRAAGGR